MNIWDILILLAVGALVLLALRAVRRGKTGGCHDCGGACACCEKDCRNRQTKTGDKEERA